MIGEHLAKVTEQLGKGPTIGKRGTPVVSFWPMRDKWKKYGDYWELWGTDGDVETKDYVAIAPAELKLIYFRIPGSETVCQLAYEHDPAEVESDKTVSRRHRRISENLFQALRKVKEQVA